MYYVWDAEIRAWRRRIVQLDLDWDFGLPPTNIVCEPIRGQLPSMLSYRLVPMKAPLVDLMWSASSFDAYSPASRALLDDFEVKFEEVPAFIHGARGRTVTSEYAYVHVLTCLNAVDWERSDVDIGTSKQGDPYVRHARHLVLTDEAIRANVPVFRLKEMLTVILVREDFRAEWERRGLTGGSFRSLDHYPKP